MALKPTICKVELDVSDSDRGHYESYALTIARHPSETDERMMVRVLAFARHAHEGLAMTDDMSNADEPAIWQRDLTGKVECWIELGHPDEKRILKACGRADQVVVYAYARSTPQWWAEVGPALARAKNLAVFFVRNSRELELLASRKMQFQCTLAEGQMWLTSEETTLEVAVDTLREVA